MSEPMTHHSEPAREAVALLPCPFCGCAPNPVPQNDDCPLPDDSGRYHQTIWCENCGAEGGKRRTGEDSIQAWNRRASPAPAAGGLEAVREALIEAEAAFEAIRIILVNELEEPVRGAFWRAVQARDASRAALAAAAASRGEDWRPVLTDMVAAMNKRDSDFGDGDIPSAHRSLMWRAEQLLASPAATSAETQDDLVSRAEVIRVIRTLGDQDADLALYGAADNARAREYGEAAATRACCAIALMPRALASPAETQGGDGVREALSRLEKACDGLAATRSQATYLAMIDNDKASDALSELDEARLHARHVIAALAPSTSAATRGEPVAWSLIWNEQYGVNTETTFKTEEEAARYAGRCLTSAKPRVIALYDRPVPAVESAQVTEALADPVAVHRNMLAGVIAKPSVANIAHLYPEVRQMRQALLATLKHFRWPTSAEHATRDKVEAALALFDEPPMTQRASLDLATDAEG